MLGSVCTNDRKGQNVAFSVTWLHPLLNFHNFQFSQLANVQLNLPSNYVKNHQGDAQWLI